MEFQSLPFLIISILVTLLATGCGEDYPALAVPELGAGFGGAGSRPTPNDVAIHDGHVYATFRLPNNRCALITYDLNGGTHSTVMFDDADYCFPVPAHDSVMIIEGDDDIVMRKTASPHRATAKASAIAERFVYQFAFSQDRETVAFTSKFTIENGSERGLAVFDLPSLRLLASRDVPRFGLKLQVMDAKTLVAIHRPILAGNTVHQFEMTTTRVKNATSFDLPEIDEDETVQGLLPNGEVVCLVGESRYRTVRAGAKEFDLAKTLPDLDGDELVLNHHFVSYGDKTLQTVNLNNGSTVRFRMSYEEGLETGLFADYERNLAVVVDGPRIHILDLNQDPPMFVNPSDVTN